jgi:hypothetical protein
MLGTPRKRPTLKRGPGVFMEPAGVEPVAACRTRADLSYSSKRAYSPTAGWPVTLTVTLTAVERIESPERYGHYLQSLDSGIIIGIARVDGKPIGQRRSRNQRVVGSRGGFAA